jgi:hypothetical protein
LRLGDLCRGQFGGGKTGEGHQAGFPEAWRPTLHRAAQEEVGAFRMIRMSITTEAFDAIARADASCGWNAARSVS